MKKIACFGSLLFLGILPFSAFGTPDLPQVLRGEVPLEDLFNEQLTVADLLDQYEKDESIPEKEKRNFLNKKNREKLKDLMKHEKLVTRALKRHETPPVMKNKYFHGDASKAEDATPEQLETYDTILKTLRDLHGKQDINRSTYDEASFVIESLRHFHANNRVISKEFEKEGTSSTYSQEGLPEDRIERPHLHISRKKEVEFQLQAEALYSILSSAYQFALENHLETQMARALSKTSGCLEDRFDHLAQWHEKRSKEFTMIAGEPADHPCVRLPDPAVELINDYFEAHYERISDMAPDQVVEEVVQFFDGQLDSGGHPITARVVRSTYNTLFLRTRTPTPNALTPHVLTSSPRSPGREMQLLRSRSNSGQSLSENLIRLDSRTSPESPRRRRRVFSADDESARGQNKSILIPPSAEFE